MDIAGKQKGSALVYILVAIALLGALTMTFMKPSSQQVTSQNSVKIASSLKVQADMIRASVQECVLLYPIGDNAIPDGGGETEEGYNDPYPLEPDSAYFTGATIGPTTGTKYVKDIRCPGNPGSDDKNHESIFSGSSSNYLPPPPDLFGDWQWYNGEEGVFFWIETDKTDPFLVSAVDKLEQQYSECEADILYNASSDVNMLNTPDVNFVCPAGSRCFRVWVVINAPNAHQDAGC